MVGGPSSEYDILSVGKSNSKGLQVHHLGAEEIFTSIG